MGKKYVIGAMIGNAISPYILEIIQGIRQAAESMQADVLFFLGIHSGFYYKLNEKEDIDNDFDYQFNTVYDYHAFTNIDALIIEYGSLGIFLNDREKKEFFEKFRNIPMVILEDHRHREHTTSIITDNYNGMYAIAEHLVKDHNYRNITYLSGPKGNTDAEERKKAVLDVMANYQVSFDENRISYGNFSSNVQSYVNELLDRYPDMEAMICANDTMAETAYKECIKRGLVVGQDIAITGYDDWELAKLMDPPLTTVLQNAKDMGYMAMIGALELCKGKKPHTVVVPAKIKIRTSCGCCKKSLFSAAPEVCESNESEQTSIQKAEEVLKEVLSKNTNSNFQNMLTIYLKELLEMDFHTPESEHKINVGFQNILNHPLFEDTLINSLIQILEQRVDECLEAELAQETIDRNAIHHLLLRKRQIHDKSVCYMIRKEKERMTDFLHESCFLPTISRDMLCYMEDEKELYKNALVKLSSLNASSSYLYVFDEPVLHHREDIWHCPSELYLAAYQEGDEVYSFDRDARPKLSAHAVTEGRLEARHKSDHYSAAVLCLFSGEEQYGVLIAEIDPSNIILFYLISREISNMLRLYQLSKEQMIMRKKLEQSVLEIQEKNEVLNFISESDPLTECLNRRGFMEKLVKFHHENEGSEAVLLFADVDHLKEINDIYGHAEGDFSIVHCSNALKKQAGKNGIVGRIGGDEFCVMIPGDQLIGDTFIREVKAMNDAFNQTSDKKYYIEMSLGYTKIIFDKDLVIADKIHDADKKLYEAKKNRRKSVQK